MGQLPREWTVGVKPYSLGRFSRHSCWGVGIGYPATRAGTTLVGVGGIKNQLTVTGDGDTIPELPTDWPVGSYFT